jgi:hypothetical protein
VPCPVCAASLFYDSTLFFVCVDADLTCQQLSTARVAPYCCRGPCCLYRLSTLVSLPFVHARVFTVCTVDARVCIHVFAIPLNFLLLSVPVSVLVSVMLYSAVLCGALWCSTVLYGALRCSAVLYSCLHCLQRQWHIAAKHGNGKDRSNDTSKDSKDNTDSTYRTDNT